MTLSFSLQLNGKPTYFPEKIIKCLYGNGTVSSNDFFDSFMASKYSKSDADIRKAMAPKLHTIRSDKANRWKAGNKIHFVINNRTPQRMQFAPVVECKSVQRIKIKQFKTDIHYHVMIWIDDELKYDSLYLCFHDTHKGDSVDEYLKQSDFIKNLSINDGFESSDHFFDYFKKDFEGKIIHWTDLTY